MAVAIANCVSRVIDWHLRNATDRHFRDAAGRHFGNGEVSSAIMLGPTTWAFVYSHVTVWIGDVDIPEELVAAARAGTLVLFVGAGASRDAPANLPDFRLLTQQIATEAAIDIEPGELDKPDELLGRIADLGVDVHLRVRSLIDAPGSWPNLLHGAIVDLAKAMPTPRIVTTNYDSHLTTVICGAPLAWDEYMAPALPMGNEFSGVVYLHGSLRQPPKRLIVTDADFGRAYIRDAWAARFLERMFGKYTVLFIGYSHGDVVMRYLARSLGPQSDRRYVLTHDPDASDWRRLDLKPVGYKLRASRHSALPEAIGRWAALLAMGQLDHRNRIAQLVAAPPSEIPEEQSYLQSVLDDERLVRHFTDLAWENHGFAGSRHSPRFVSSSTPMSMRQTTLRHLPTGLRVIAWLMSCSPTSRSPRFCPNVAEVCQRNSGTLSDTTSMPGRAPARRGCNGGSSCSSKRPRAWATNGLSLR